MSDGGRISKIYICAPFLPETGSQEEKEQAIKVNKERILSACKLLAKVGYMPLAPVLYFPHFVECGDSIKRHEMNLLTLEWLLSSDEVWVFGQGSVTDEMMQEIFAARKRGITVRTMPEPAVLAQKILDGYAMQAQNKEREDKDHE